MNAIAHARRSTLHIWRRIYQGDAVTSIPPAARVAAAANLVAAIVEKGAPVYGINTGSESLRR